MLCPAAHRKRKVALCSEKPKRVGRTSSRPKAKTLNKTLILGLPAISKEDRDGEVRSLNDASNNRKEGGSTKGSDSNYPETNPRSIRRLKGG